MEIKLNNTQLSFLRTHLALQRTYMASLRTVAIFVGLSLLLTNKVKREKIALIITITTLMLTLFSTYSYLKKINVSDKYYNLNSRVISDKTDDKIPIAYAICIIIIQFVLIITYIKDFWTF